MRPSKLAVLHRSIFVNILLATVLSLCSLQLHAETWDLADDWSDSLNPNGVWSYNKSPGSPFTMHWDDWDPSSGCCFASPQPAWAATQWPNVEHVPMWMKVVSETTTRTPDFPIGRVIMHGVQGVLPPVGAGVTWTSPVDDVITIEGGVWLGNFTSTRSMDWTIMLNGVPLTEGSLNALDPGSSVAPNRYEDGSGGPAVLTQAVTVGDIITLEFSKTSTFATFVGVDFAIRSTDDVIFSSSFEDP